MIRFLYLKPKYAGRATIAYDAKTNDNGTITFCAGITYCDPKDQYKKYYGRDKAKGRLVQLMSCADGYRMADREPDKFQTITLPATGTADTDFLNTMREIAFGFVPAAVN